MDPAQKSEGIAPLRLLWVALPANRAGLPGCRPVALDGSFDSLEKRPRTARILCVDHCARLIPLPTNNIARATLQAALIGYQVELQTIDRRIAEIRRQLRPRSLKSIPPRQIRIPSTRNHRKNTGFCAGFSLSSLSDPQILAACAGKAAIEAPSATATVLINRFVAGAHVG